MSREIKILITEDKLSFLEIINPMEVIMLSATDYREETLIIRDSYTREYKLSLINNTEYTYTVYLDDTNNGYTSKIKSSIGISKIYNMIRDFKLSEYKNKLTVQQKNRSLSVFIDDLNKEIVIKRKDNYYRRDNDG